MTFRVDASVNEMLTGHCDHLDHDWACGCVTCAKCRVLMIPCGNCPLPGDKPKHAVPII